MDRYQGLCFCPGSCLDDQRSEKDSIPTFNRMSQLLISQYQYQCCLRLERGIILHLRALQSHNVHQIPYSLYLANAPIVPCEVGKLAITTLIPTGQGAFRPQILLQASPLMSRLASCPISPARSSIQSVKSFRHKLLSSLVYTRIVRR
jgi:hypothetical protein